MEKYFMPFVIIIMIMSTIVVAAAGDHYLSSRQGEKICVQSRSCAINYMNKLESEHE
jgi:hypothetical protein